MVSLSALNTVAKFWDEASTGFDEEHNTEDLALWAVELEKEIGLNGNGRILDVGTGTGFLALLLARLGYEVVGVDVAEKMLEQGRRKALDAGLDVEFIHGLCEELPFPDCSFDAVVNCRVMWTLTEPETAVSEWRRVIRPGGKLISYMRMMSISDKDTEGYYGKNIELPLRCGGRDEYVEVYKAAGFKRIITAELPEEMSCADMPGWTSFTGIK